MKHLNGLETAEKIRQLDRDVYLVFVTNLANYAIKGYSVQAFDFILKYVESIQIDTDFRIIGGLLHSARDPIRVADQKAFV